MADILEQIAAAARRQPYATAGLDETVLTALDPVAPEAQPRRRGPGSSASESGAASAPAPVSAERAPVRNPEPAAAPAPPEPIDGATLEELGAAVQNCHRCPLARTRTNVVYGEGNPRARLMFVGEGPGGDEDLQGRPFVGRAGQLLDKMIAAMQFSRAEVYIANIVKCRPPGNRAPTPEEAEQCIGYLRRQIGFIRPEVIVVLGATAAKFLLNRQEGITRLRGRWFEYDGIPVMATFHPAYLLRQESAKREAWADLQQVMARFGKTPPRRRR